MKLLTLNEVARVMRVSESTVRRLIREGLLIAYKIGKRGQLRIRIEDLEKYLEAQVVQSGSTDSDDQDKSEDRGGNE